jgi:hypothetical protein
VIHDGHLHGAVINVLAGTPVQPDAEIWDLPT